jgi:hypothetical protein
MANSGTTTWPTTADSWVQVGTANYRDESGYSDVAIVNQLMDLGTTIESVLGTTGGTNLFGGYSAGDFPLKASEVSGGTANALTIGTATIGTASITGGTATGLVLSNYAYNVLDYGTALTHTTIQAALDAGSATGGEVFCPRGTWTLGTSIEIHSNQTLRGEGYNTIFKYADNVASPGFNGIVNSGGTAGNNNIILRDFTVDGNAANNGSGTVLNMLGIYLIAGTNVLVEGVNVINTTGQIVQFQQCSGLRFIGNYIKDTDSEYGGCVFESCTDYVIANNYINDVHGKAIGLYPNNAANKRFAVIGNVINEYGDTGIHCDASGGVIKGNTIITTAAGRNGARGIALFNNYGTTPAEHIVIQGNYIEGCRRNGIGLSGGDLAGSANYVTVDSNILKNTGFGTEAANYTSGIYVGPGTAITITNNNILNSGYSSTNGSITAGISADGSAPCTIMGNTCTDSQGTAYTQMYGIRMYYDVQHLVVGNRCLGNGTAIYKGGTTNIIDEHNITA